MSDSAKEIKALREHCETLTGQVIGMNAIIGDLVRAAFTSGVTERDGFIRRLDSLITEIENDGETMGVAKMATITLLTAYIETLQFQTEEGEEATGVLPKGGPVTVGTILRMKREGKETGDLSSLEPKDSDAILTSRLTIDGDAMNKAYERGLKAGEAGKSSEDNPYDLTDNSTAMLNMSWEDGLHDGSN